MVSSTPRPYFTPGKDPVPIVQVGPWPVWTGGKSRPTGIRSPDCPAYSQSLIPTELPGPHKYKKMFKNAMTYSCTCTKLWDVSFNIIPVPRRQMHKSNLVDFIASLFHRIDYLWWTKRYQGQVKVFKYLSIRS